MAGRGSVKWLVAPRIWPPEGGLHQLDPGIQQLHELSHHSVGVPFPHQGSQNLDAWALNDVAYTLPHVAPPVQSSCIGEVCWTIIPLGAKVVYHTIIT